MNTQIMNTLSTKELRIVILLGQGATDGQVSYYARVSIDDLKKHLARIYKKLNIQTNTELLRIYSTASWDKQMQEQ